jgi:hypothetical protein
VCKFIKINEPDVITNSKKNSFEKNRLIVKGIIQDRDILDLLVGQNTG